jgi:hypothetical protein
MKASPVDANNTVDHPASLNAASLGEKWKGTPQSATSASTVWPLTRRIAEGIT